MVYLCIFGEYNKDMGICLDKTGFIENKPVVTDIESEYRATYMSEQSSNMLEKSKDVIVTFKMSNGSTYTILDPFSGTKYYTYCDLITYKYLKRHFGDEVVAVLIEGDVEKYTNQLEDYTNEEYRSVADIKLSKHNTPKECMIQIERYIGRKQNENLFKMYDHNIK